MRLKFSFLICLISNWVICKGWPYRLMSLGIDIWIYFQIIYCLKFLDSTSAKIFNFWSKEILNISGRLWFNSVYPNFEILVKMLNQRLRYAGWQYTILIVLSTGLASISNFKWVSIVYSSDILILLTLHGKPKSPFVIWDDNFPKMIYIVNNLLIRLYK